MKPAVIPHTSIIVEGRIRKDLGDIESLMDLIRESGGLIQPLVINEKKELVAGGRRWTAIDKLSKEDIKWSQVPVVLNEYVEGSEAKLRKLELIENLGRKDLNWKELCQGTANLHKLLVREKVLNGERWTQKLTGHLLNMSTGNVNYCLVVSKLLEDPNSPVQKADSLSEAFRILAQIKEDEVNKYNATFGKELLQGAVITELPSETGPLLTTAEQGASIPGATLSIDALLKKGQDGQVIVPNAPMPTGRLPVMKVDVSKYLQLGDCLVHMDAMKEGEVSHICTDSPYAIEMKNLTNVDRVQEQHQVEANIKLMKAWWPLAFKVIKDRGFCCVWYDYEWHGLMTELAKSAGFAIQRWPLHWVKTGNCKNDAAQYNFTKATEVCLVCRKGNATLQSPQGVNYWIGDHGPEKKDHAHPFYKPWDLWKWVMNAVASKNDFIYDPFAGEGSAVMTAIRSGFYPRASELEETHYNRMVADFRELLQTRYGKTHSIVFL